MKHRVYYEQENGVLRVEIVGELMYEEASPIIHTIQKELAVREHGYILADMSRTPSFQLDRKTRKILQEEAVTLNLDKIAIVGANPVIRMLAKVLVTVIGRGKSSQFFKTDKEALAWLKGR